jgi:Rrf2 family protein
MNITTKGRYALRVMADLAMHRDEGYVSLSAVSERQQLSVKYLEMIVGHLKKAGLIESSRGKDGGYMLCREPEKYTVGEVLRSIEENLAPVSCLNGGESGCERAAKCITLPMWKEFDEIANSYFDSVTLADLLTGERWKKS